MPRPSPRKLFKPDMHDNSLERDVNQSPGNQSLLEPSGPPKLHQKRVINKKILAEIRKHVKDEEH
jgi:hypothetical protein